MLNYKKNHIQSLIEAKSFIQKNFNDNANHFFLLIILSSPFLLFFEFRPILTDYVSSHFMIIADWVKLMTYSFIIFETLNIVLGKAGFIDSRDKKDTLKKYFVFTGKLIIIFIAMRSIPVVFALIAVPIHGIIPILNYQNITATIILVASVYCAVSLVFILPEHIDEQKLNLANAFTKIQKYLSQIILSTILASLLFVIILGIYKNIKPYLQHWLLKSDIDLANAITAKILDLPITLFVEPYILIIATISLGLFYKKSQKTN